MMKKKKGIVLILISLIIVAMVGIISYNLFKKDISTKQLQSGVTSTVNADTEVKNYTLTFIDRDSDRKVEISASSSDTIKSKLEVAEQKFNDIYSDSFATYREDGYKYEFSKSDDIIKRWSTNESIWVPITSAYVGGNSTLYAMYDKTPTTEKFNYKIDLIKDAVTGGPNALYIVKNTGKIYTDPSCENKDEVVDHTVKVPTKEGYIFNGTSDGTIDLNGIVNVDYLINRSKVRDRKENVKWKLNEYNITYNGIENCMYSPNPATYTIETDTITLNNPTKSGYIFKGWTGSNGETPQKTVTIPKGSVGNKTYTANWEKTSTDSGRAYDLKVHFLLNEGTDGQQTLYRKKDVGFYKDAECTDENKVKPGVDNEIKIPTRTGYIFKGYTCTVAGKTYEISDKGNISISQYNDLIGKDLSFFEGYLLGGELEFKAQWSNIYHHIITLNPDNGEQPQQLYVINTGDKRGIYKNKACDEDNKVVANTDGQINIPSKTGYTFVGYTGISKTGSIDTSAMNYFIDGITENTEFKANWEAKKYRIVLNKNDGTDSKDYLYVKYGDGIYKDEKYENKLSNTDSLGRITIDKDKIPTRDGYKFNGFLKDGENTNLTIDSTGAFSAGVPNFLINEDTTEDYNLYAKWIPVYYLEFLINDGDRGTYSAYISKDMKMYEDKNCTIEMSKIQVAERKGFIFDGYSLEDDTTNSFDTEGKLIDESPLVKNIKAGVYKAGDSIKLNGKWKNIYDYKIKLNSDNDGGASKYLYVVKAGTKKGIYKNEECDDDKIVVANTDSQIEVPTKTGHIFKGYRYEEKNANYISDTGSISDTDMKSLIDDVSNDIEFKADWEAKKYEIVLNKNYDRNGKNFLYVIYGVGIYKDSNYQEKYNRDIYGRITIDNDKIPTRDGYKFNGFYSLNTEGLKTYEIDSNGTTVMGTTGEGGYDRLVSQDGDYNLFAEWLPIAVTDVTLDESTLNLKVNDERKLIATITPDNAADKSVTFSSSDTSVAKVSADGIVTALKAGTATITVTTTDGNKTARCGVTVTDNTQQDKKVYKVKFDSNGGIGTMENQEFTMDESKKLAANTFSREGYTFAGWNTKADGTGTSYKDSESVTNLTTANNGTVTLYAQWTGKQVNYTVEHYKQQEDKTYKIADTDNKSGTVGTTVKAEQKTYEGYTYNSSKSTSSGTVQADGKLVLKMYYDLSSTVAKYTVKYYKEDSTGKYSEVKEDETTETGTIGEKVTATVKAYEGYMYDNEKSKEYISDEVKEDGSLVLGVYYKKLKNVYLEITVKDSTTQKVKEGVKVTLYTEDGKEISTQISDIVGKVAFENLEKGKTYIYKIEGDSKEYKFKVTEDGKIEDIKDDGKKDDNKTDDNKTDDNKTDDNKTDDNKTDNKGNNSNSSNSQTNGQIDNTKASSVIPKAGITGKIILFAIVGLTCVIGISYIKYKNLNKIC